MKKAIKFLVTVSLLSLLDTSSGSSTSRPDTETPVTSTQLITSEVWETSSLGERSTPINTAVLMNGLTEETGKIIESNEVPVSTTQVLNLPSTASLIEESNGGTVTDAIPTSLPRNRTTETVTDANMRQADNNSASQDPSVTLVKGSTPEPITGAPTIVSTEHMGSYSTIALAGTTAFVDAFHTNGVEIEIQTDPTGTSAKILSSDESKSELATSQVPRETTFVLADNDITSLGSPLSTILGDDDITLLDYITTASQWPSSSSEDMASSSVVPRKTFLVVLTLSGSCSLIFHTKDDKEKFMEAVKVVLVQHFEFLEEEHVVMVDVICGSVLVELIVEMSEKDKTEFDLDMRENFAFTYKTQVLQVVNTSFEDFVEGTTPVITTDDGDGPISLNFQETLIFIVIGSVVGAFVFVSLFLLCQYLVQKWMRAGKKSFSPTDEPCIKLSDFNMAHTYIPRPQSIYSATTRSSFLPYESMDVRCGYSSASPTPNVYADGDQIREHYQEVVDKDQAVTPTTKTINDFGKSGIPSWDLPVLEGVVQEGANGPTSKEEHQVATISTFHVPPDENGIPPPPTTSPPPPPPTVRYHPQGHLGPEGNSLKSDDGSNHTEQSSGDTRQLIRAENHDVGVDNPAVELDSAYF